MEDVPVTYLTASGSLQGHGYHLHQLLAGIPQKRRAFVAPLVFYPIAFRLAAHYAAVRGYALEGRRYMWQFDY